MKMSIPLTLSTRKHKTLLAQPLKKPQQTKSHIRKKGAQSNKTPRHKNHLIPERKSFHTYFQKKSYEFFWPSPPIIFLQPQTGQEQFDFHTYLLRQFLQHNRLNLPIHFRRRQDHTPHSQQVPLNTYTKQPIVLLQVRPHQPPIPLRKLRQPPTIQLIARHKTVWISNVQRSTRCQREQITTWIR